jgi:pimeloyl-ACP methyl ester carboxylesterase
MQWEEFKITEGKYADQFYTKCGTGSKTLLLIHGYAESALIFEEIVTHLQNDFTIILPNLPGTSHTNILQGQASIEALADFCLHILQLEKVHQYFLCGHSLGGYISLHLLANYANNILGLSLLNSHCYADDDAKKVKRQQAIDLAQSGKASEVLSTLVTSIYPEVFKKDNPEKVAQHIKLALSINADGVKYYNKAMMNRQDHSATLSNATIPINLIIADEDTTCPQDQLRNMLVFPTIADVCILRNCGHQGMVQYPKQVGSKLQFFMQLCQFFSGK